MIVKSMARKSATFGQLLAYLNRPAAKGAAILHNLATSVDDLAAIRRELADNARLLSRRRNGNLLYHEVLSFGAGDRDKLSPEILEDLVRRYLELRAPHALAYAKAHLDRRCTHVHLVISANDVAATRRLRLDRRRFRQVVVTLERYQKRCYPQLEHSLVHEVRQERSGARRRRGEAERDKRLREQGRAALSAKELLALQVEEQLNAARSEESLLLRLSLLGLELYVRGSKVGVLDRSSGRRTRLETLGLADLFASRLAEWARQRERLQGIHRVEQERGRREWLEHGFRDELALVLAGAGQPVSVGERDRHSDLSRMLREKFRRGRDEQGRER